MKNWVQDTLIMLVAAYLIFGALWLLLGSAGWVLGIFQLLTGKIASAGIVALVVVGAVIGLMRGKPLVGAIALPLCVLFAVAGLWLVCKIAGALIAVVSFPFSFVGFLALAVVIGAFNAWLHKPAARAV